MRNRTNAFTLVELLVVIGIIALLISILLPSLNNARRAATAVKCLSNLKMIGAGVNMYSNDNKGAILPGDVQFKSDGSVREYWPMLLAAGKYIPVPNINGNDTTPGASSVFLCPAGRMALIQSINTSDTGNPIQHFDLSNAAATATTPLAADGVRRFFSSRYLTPAARPLPASPSNGYNGGAIIDCNYAINGSAGPYSSPGNPNVNTGTYVEKFSDQYLPAQSITVVPGSTYTSGITYKMGSFKRAANTVFIMDGLGDNLFNTSQVSPGCIWRIAGARHGQRYPSGQTGEVLFKTGTTNVLFLDGHVEGIKRDRLPYAAGGGNVQMSGKSQMLCNRGTQPNSIQSTDLVWNLRQQ